MHPETMRQLASIRTRELHDEAAGSILLANARESVPRARPRRGRVAVVREVLERGLARGVSAASTNVGKRVHR
jgi:hypothetical protein